jgi:hypothetical protein
MWDCKWNAVNPLNKTEVEPDTFRESGNTGNTSNLVVAYKK